MNYKALISLPDGQDVEVKSGRVISNRNMSKLRQALELLTEVVESSQKPETKQYNLVIAGEASDLLQVKSLIEPVLEFYGVSAYEDGRGIVIDDADYLDEEAVEALESVISAYGGHDLKA